MSSGSELRQKPTGKIAVETKKWIDNHETTILLQERVPHGLTLDD